MPTPEYTEHFGIRRPADGESVKDAYELLRDVADTVDQGLDSAVLLAGQARDDALAAAAQAANPSLVNAFLFGG